MQSYEIVFAPTAEEDLENVAKWLLENAPEKLREWMLSIRAVIETLSTMPQRCPYAPENGLWGDEELRQLLFQEYPSKYRIIYTIHENEVRILNIRHGARRFLHQEEK